MGYRYRRRPLAGHKIPARRLNNPICSKKAPSDHPHILTSVLATSSAALGTSVNAERWANSAPMRRMMGGSGRKDSDDSGVSTDLFVQPILVVVPDLAPLVPREPGEGQDL